MGLARSFLLTMLSLQLCSLSVKAQDAENPVQDSVWVDEDGDTTIYNSSDEEDDAYSDYDEEKYSLPIISKRTLPTDSLQEIRNQKEFGYMQYIDSALRNYKGEEPTSEPPLKEITIGVRIFRLTLAAIGIFAVLFIIWKLWLSKSGAFTSAGKISQEELFTAESTPEDNASLAAMAVRNKDYRMAVRYLFLDLLHQLNNRGYVHATPEKTNQQYLYEIAQPGMRQALATAMLQYEYVWYGELVPTEKQFGQINSTFQQFKNTWLS